MWKPGVALTDKSLLIGGERMMTTQSALALEHRVIALAEAGRGAAAPWPMAPTCPPVCSNRRAIWASAASIPAKSGPGSTSSNPRIGYNWVQGGAGVGKPAALMPVAHILKSMGRDVHALAHAGRTARDFGAKLRVSASTVDSFLGRYRRVMEGTASPEQLAEARPP